MSRLSRDSIVLVATIVCLYVLAAAVRLYAAAQLPFPATEAAAYYAGVAEHVVRGQGLVSDAVWSYATPPLVAPKPAFELWMPLGTFVSVVAMTWLGPTYWAGQVGSALLGASLAPLAWAVARAAARAGGLEPRRVAAVAVATGVLAAVLAPFVLNAAVPDSYTPFVVSMLATALLVPAALGLPGRPAEPRREPTRWAGVAVGVCLGLAYLARQEAVWLGLAILFLSITRVRGEAPGSRGPTVLRILWPIVAGGLIIVVPWLARNALEFGSPFPGQAIENLFLRRNEDIFAFTDRPSAGSYLAQGIGTLLWNPTAAAWSALVDVLLLPALPVGLVGLVSLVGLWRSPSLRHPTPLQVLLVSGALTFFATALLFPVASRWGTYQHASGPLLVGLTATAALGADAFLAKVSRWRGWPRANIVIGPVALVVVALVMGGLQVQLLADQTRGHERRYRSVAVALAELQAASGTNASATLMTDHPMWLATVTGAPAIALPDEDLASLHALGERFGTDQLVVMDERGRYPAALLGPGSAGCLSDEPIPLGDPEQPAWLFRLAETCRG